MTTSAANEKPAAAKDADVAKAHDFGEDGRLPDRGVSSYVHNACILRILQNRKTLWNDALLGIGMLFSHAR